MTNVETHRWRVQQYKRPLGLTAPLSNNTLSIIHSPMNAQWPWFDLSMLPKVKCHRVNWKSIYDLLYVFHAKFNKMLHLGDITFWKSCDLDLTKKDYPRSNVLTGFPPKMSNKIPWLFPDFQRKFPDHFIDNWLSSYIVCKHIRQITVMVWNNSFQMITVFNLMLSM